MNKKHPWKILTPLENMFDFYPGLAWEETKF